MTEPALLEASTTGPDRPRILTFTTLFPNPAQPRLGVFVRDRVAAVAAYCPTRVVAPVLRRLGRRLELRGATPVPAQERQLDIEVHHPRFATMPGVGRCADGMLLFLQTVTAITHLRARFPFDLIDAHYAFPDGMAAVLLGRHFGVPACVTIRGGDIDLLPRFHFRRRAIRWTLERAARVFAVSQHLAAGAAALGVEPELIRVVPNGIDTHKFAPIERNAARRTLGIPEDRRMLLCVGNLLAEKGQHVLIETLARLDVGALGTPHLTIVGSDQWGKKLYLQQLERRVSQLRLQDRVHLVGAKPQAELPVWYSAADLLVLPTFREGCPNVVREALACGTPVVASQVGGVPELITSGALGLMVEPGNVQKLADAIDTALRRKWDRVAIAATCGQRTWQSAGAEIAAELRILSKVDLS